VPIILKLQNCIITKSNHFLFPKTLFFLITVFLGAGTTTDTAVFLIAFRFNTVLTSAAL